jgi:predicted nuclease of restriction endonuclease-like (RecB) superfamily
MSNTIDKTGGNSIDNQLFSKVAQLIELARKKVATTVNLTMVHTYFEIGRMIVEDEQQGKERAAYGKAVLKDLSIRLIERFGKGFSVDNLQNMRQFYLAYSIYETPSRKLQSNENQSDLISATPLRNFKKVSADLQMPRFQISWSHYLILMRIENPQERSFYEIECAANNWSLKDLNRQYHSSLYERLALSRNKEEVMKLANEGHTVVKPVDILKNPLTLEFLGMDEKDAYSESDMEHAILSNAKDAVMAVARKEQLPELPQEIVKDPMILEFLGLERKPHYYEKDLETALIEHLQQFMLELGNGFHTCRSTLKEILF